MCHQLIHELIKIKLVYYRLVSEVRESGAQGRRDVL